MDDSQLNRVQDVAVFFDFENIVYSLRNNYGINANFEDLMDKCKEFGRVIVARAFADWNRQSSSMIPALISNGFDPVYVPSFYTNENGKVDLRKNAVDMYMAIDAMDVMHNRQNVDTFILLTGDSDFLPMVNAIRREGNRVIAIGVDGTVSSHLAQAVDEFIFYSQVSNIPSMNNKRKRRPSDIYEGLTDAIKKLQKGSRSTVLPNVKMMMAEQMGGFDEKKHADKNGRRFQKFKEFVQEAERRGLVQLVTTGTVNEVFLSGDEIPQSAKEEPVELTLDEAYDLLIEAVNIAIANDRSLRTSSIKGIMMETHGDFDEKKIVLPEGVEPFGRFSEFITSASEKGLVSLIGESTQLEVHLPGSNPAVSETESEQPPKAEKSEKPEKSDSKERSNKKDKRAKSADKAPKPVDNLPARELILDGLRSFQSYPAAFLQIEAHCRHVRNERGFDLSSPKVREILTHATREIGLLERISPHGVSPAQYDLRDEEELVARFFGMTTEAYQAHISDSPEESTEDVQIEVVDEAAQPQEEVDVTSDVTEPIEAETEVAVEDTAAETQEEAETEQETTEAEIHVEAESEETESTEAETEVEVVAEPEQDAVAEPEPEPEPAEAQPETIEIISAFDLLAKAIMKANEENRSTKIAPIKRQMKSIDPTFSEDLVRGENGATFKRFGDFVREAAKRGVIILSGEGVRTEMELPSD